MEGSALGVDRRVVYVDGPAVCSLSLYIVSISSVGTCTRFGTPDFLKEVNIAETRLEPSMSPTLRRFSLSPRTSLSNCAVVSCF